MFRLLKIPMAAVITVFLLNSWVMALPTMKISDGVNTAVIEDTDGDGVMFYASWADASNTFDNSNLSLSVTTGLTKPTIGAADDPQLHLDSVDITTGGATTLTISLTDTDFIRSSLDPFSLLTELGGVTSGSVSLSAYLDANNTAFGMGTLIGETDSLTGSFADSDLWTNVLEPNSPYSLSLIATIAHNGFGGITSFDAQTSAPVPEPATMLLLGTGLAGMAVVRRRRNRRG